MMAARNHCLSEAARRWNSLGREMGKDTARRARALSLFAQSRLSPWEVWVCCRVRAQLSRTWQGDGAGLLCRERPVLGAIVL